VGRAWCFTNGRALFNTPVITGTYTPSVVGGTGKAIIACQVACCFKVEKNFLFAWLSDYGNLPAFG